MLVTAAMIVRDEEAVLAACLASIRDVVDEIVVVDTGSTDRSIEIARAHGAAVTAMPWRDDFSAARNAALDRARGRFILYIDADERLRPISRDAVCAALSDDTIIGHTVLFRPQVGYTPYREHRVFKNDPRIRFRGAIHESMLAGLFDVAARDGLRIAPSALAIDHVGYEGDQTSKHRRNLPLLRARLAAEPDHVFSWHHLGRVLDALGDPDGAAEAWERGVEAVRRRVEPSPGDCLVFGSLLRHRIDRGQADDALLDEARARFPDNYQLLWLDGRRLLAASRLEDAHRAFAALAAVDAETFTDDGVAYDARIFGEWAEDALGLCCFRLGRFAESAEHYRRAEALSADGAAYRARRRLAEARAGGGR